MDMDALLTVERLANRFNGLSIDFRRTDTDWPKSWRLKVYSSKDSRDKYRITEYFDTLEDLVFYAQSID